MVTKEFWIDKTTNPDIIKIIFDEQIIKGSIEFSSVDEASQVPLAKTLLSFPFVKKIFMTSNFMAVEKNDIVEWEDVLEDMKEVVKEHQKEEIVKHKKEPYSVYIEMTPNPDVMKFVANKILTNGMIDIKSKEETSEVPLAEYLYEFPFIQEVFIYQNYISITKDKNTLWDAHLVPLREFIQNYLQEGKIISNISHFQTFEQNRKKPEELTETEKEIQIILDEYVNPAVANDGGNIELITYDEATKTAKMLLKGACSGCPSSTMTLKNGIETMLVQMLPDKIKAVEAVNG